MADYRLERLNDGNEEKWEEFNKNSPEGSFFHGLKWTQIAEQSSGVKRHYFLLYKDEDVFGIFPFIEDKIHVFRGLRTARDPKILPAILKDSGDPHAMNSVIRDLQKVTIDGKKISFIRVSTLHEEMLNTITTHPRLPWKTEGGMVLNLLEFPPEKIWNTFSAKKGERKFIRRFEKDGFALTEANSPEDLALFYKYYQENISHIKGRLQPFSRFSKLWNSLSDEIRITLLSKGSVFAGGMFQLLDSHRKTVHTMYLSLNRNLPTNYHPPYYLWWEAINWAYANRYEKVSLGGEHLDENNPRYRMMYDLGARFEPTYSAMIPLTKIFTLGATWKWGK